MPRRSGSRLHDILLAETLRVHENAGRAAAVEPRAEADARAQGGNFAQRIIARAGAHPLATDLNAALGQVRGAVILAFVSGAVIALIAGAGAVQTVMGSASGAPLNFFRLLAVLLGLPTLALFAWLGLLLVRPRGGTGGILGKAILAIGGRLARALHGGPHAVSAVQAVGAVFSASRTGYWGLSAISHALWLAYFAGVIGLVLFYLSTQEFTFAWETTILSERSYIAMTRAIAVIPEILGLATPGDAEVIASQSGATAAAVTAENARSAWAGLLIGSLLAYGALPRLVLLPVCLITAWWSARRTRLDTTHPYYARLRPRLMPVAQHIGVVDAPRNADQDRPGADDSQGPAPDIGGEGPFAILGLEIDPPQGGWPPHIPGATWLDLGFVDDRASRRVAIERLKQPEDRPRGAVIVCALPQTPDRSTKVFIHGLQAEGSVAALVLLTGGQHLRQRGHTEQVSQRVADWRQTAAAAGVPDERIIEADLDHVTAATRDRLARWLGLRAVTSAHSPAIDQAFALICHHAAGWREAPSPLEQAELHRAIAKVYDGGGAGWQERLSLRFDEGRATVDQLKSGAESVVKLLPARLKANAFWLSAGALTGAMGCVAAATLVAPLAIASLPAWAGLGAAVAAAVRAVTGNEPATPDEMPGEFGPAVASAALFALILHLQGRDEAEITQTLDEVFGDEQPPVIHDAIAARAWLDQIAHRLEQIEMSEVAP